MEALAHPRWEDFDYTYLNSNSFGWFGNGWTQNELQKDINVDYLNEENIDFPIPQQVVLNENGHKLERGDQPTKRDYSARL